MSAVITPIIHAPLGLGVVLAFIAPEAGNCFCQIRFCKMAIFDIAEKQKLKLIPFTANIELTADKHVGRPDNRLDSSVTLGPLHGCGIQCDCCQCCLWALPLGC